MRKLTKSYREDLVKRLRNPKYAATYLNTALMDDDPAVFLIALKDVADAQGESMARIAKKAHLNRESLYRTLSKGGNPRLYTLHALLEALGFHLAVQPSIAA